LSFSPGQASFRCAYRYTSITADACVAVSPPAGSRSAGGCPEIINSYNYSDKTGYLTNEN